MGREPFELVGAYPITARLVCAEIDAAPELWGAQGFRKTLAAHHQMDDIWVRYNRPTRLGSPGFNDEHVPVWYPAAGRLPAVKRFSLDFMRDADGEMLGGVLITRIPPGCSIAPHVDTGWHVNYFTKFYLSLKSAPGADFCFEGHTLNPKPGQCWRIDNREKHWVVNNSNEDRMTLIVCIKTDRFGQ